ncbi:MAG: hypothetical protein A2X36_16340 [Elusimicrobia bacterium GWA2_69_24]|nr:MAG: hypothetical protein A2X36_16340 [Elusimicrobia bacterium GWA2_69_24]
MVKNLFVGTPKNLTGSSVLSAIERNPVAALSVGFDAIAGDLVADPEHHGGRNRVLHQYPLEHYAVWGTRYPGIEFSAGGMGENLTSAGCTEDTVCIGDLFRIGSVRCVVTEPRKPCATIDVRYRIKGLARRVQEECRTGWFYRIISEGAIEIGDAITLLERPYPRLTLAVCVRALLLAPDRETLERMASNPVLSHDWRQPARELLSTGTLADDRKRLGDASP